MKLYNMRGEPVNTGLETTEDSKNAPDSSSSAGILIRTESLLSLGRTVEVALTWPCLLDERVPLQLIVHGRVVRTGAGQLAVALKRFEFRTAKAAKGDIEVGLPQIETQGCTLTSAESVVLR